MDTIYLFLLLCQPNKSYQNGEWKWFLAVTRREIIQLSLTTALIATQASLRQTPLQPSYPTNDCERLGGARYMYMNRDTAFLDPKSSRNIFKEQIAAYVQEPPIFF